MGALGFIVAPKRKPHSAAWVSLEGGSRKKQDDFLNQGCPAVGALWERISQKNGRNLTKDDVNIQYTRYKIQDTIYNIQYTIYNIQYIIYNDIVIIQWPSAQPATVPRFG